MLKKTLSLTLLFLLTFILNLSSLSLFTQASAGQRTQSMRETQKSFKDKLDVAKLKTISTKLGGQCVSSSGVFTLCNKPTHATLKRIYESQENGEIYQMVLEPISDENIAYLAKVCFNEPIKDASTKAYQTNTVGDKTYLILGNRNCEDYFVTKCRPSASGTKKLIEIDNSTGGLSEDIETSTYCSRVQFFFGSSGADLLQKYVGYIYKFVASIAAIVAIAVIIINGIRVTVGESDLASAKDNIARSLAALAILFLASIILNAVNPNFFRGEITEEAPAPAPEAPAEEDNSNGR